MASLHLSLRQKIVLASDSGHHRRKFLHDWTAAGATPTASTVERRRGSPERERVGRHAWIEKLDFELPIGDGLRLSDQLVQPLLDNHATALVVNIGPMSRARRLSVNAHPESHPGPSRCRSHDKMKIAGVKTIHNPPVGLVQHRSLLVHGPIT
jgi:hypothetical protein